MELRTFHDCAGIIIFMPVPLAPRTFFNYFLFFPIVDTLISHCYNNSNTAYTDFAKKGALYGKRTDCSC